MENKSERLNNSREEQEKKASNTEKGDVIQETSIKEKETGELIEEAISKDSEETEKVKVVLGKRGFEEFKKLKKTKEELSNKRGDGSISDSELVKLKQVNRKIEIANKNPSFKEILEIEKKNKESKNEENKEDINEYYLKFGDEIIKEREDIEEEITLLTKKTESKREELKGINNEGEKKNNLSNEIEDLEGKHKRILKMLKKEGVLELFEWKDNEDKIEKEKKFEKKREKTTKELEKEGAEWVEIEKGSAKGDRIEVTDDQIEKAKKEMEKDFKERREGSKAQKFLLKALNVAVIPGYLIQALGYVWGKIWEGVDMINKRFGGKSFWK